MEFFFLASTIKMGEYLDHYLAFITRYPDGMSLQVYLANLCLMVQCLRVVNVYFVSFALRDAFDGFRNGLT